MKIIKKCDKDMFEMILSGKKKFEVRLGDVKVDEGDILILKECEKYDGKETGRQIEKKIGFVLNTKDMPWWTEEEKNKNGFIIMGFKE
jgi:hypothetical protein